jgi:endonuclease-8
VRRSYRTGGITVPPALERRLKAMNWSYEERRFHVFGRDGGSCHVCGSEVERLTASGRNLFLCPACQPR